MIAVFSIWHASLIEIIWTFMGLVGLYYNRYNLSDTNKYMHAVEKLNGNNLLGYNLMRVIAAGHYRNELFRTAGSAFVLIVGVLSMLAPATASAAKGITPVGAIVTMGIFALQLVLIIIPSALDKRQRELMGRMGDQEQELEAQSREA